VCYDNRTQVEFIQAIKNIGWSFIRSIVWNKTNFGLSGGKGYRPKYELIAFGCIKGTDYQWYGDNPQADVWDIARPQDRPGNHPTPKPVEVVSRALKNSSKKGDLIQDSFSGVGATVVASHQLDRRCNAMELKPQYVSVIIRRLLEMDNSLTVICENREFDTSEFYKK